MVPSYSYELLGQGLANAIVTAAGKALAVGRDLALDPLTGDLALAGGDLFLVTDGEAVRQEADIRLSFFLGEWFLDTGAGVPYFQNILVKAPNLAAIRTIFIDEIEAVTGIKTITKLTLDFDRQSRTLKVNWAAVIDTGELISSALEF